MDHKKEIKDSLALIFEGIDQLKNAFPNRAFTIDGRLVGDIGEVVAALTYDIELHEKSLPEYDGVTSDGRRVQVKATFKDTLYMTTVPDFFLGLKLSEDGTCEEIFNGPGKVIYENYKHLKGIGERPGANITIVGLRKLNKTVPEADRIKKRRA
jgi:hypothetical protein